MSEFRDHPSQETLDLWRAGLLDGHAEGELARHIDACARCRDHAAMWSAAAPERELHPGVAGQLRARRRAVLEGRGRRAGSGAPSRLLVGVAAALTLALGIGAFIEMQGPSQPNGGIEANTGPNLYAELDFYIWLENQQPQETGQPGNGTL